MSSANLEYIQTDKLVPHPKNPRLIMRQDVIDGIKTSIESSGLFNQKHSISVRPVGDYYEVISGHHRLEAAKAANCDLIPCWVEEMDDDKSEMELVLSNNQGELSPLEYGLHALHCVPLGKVGAGRGNKDGLSEYARAVNRPQQTLDAWRKAANVFQTVKNYFEENYPSAGNFKASDFIDKPTHLAAIHASPSESWPALCDFLLTAQDVTVAKISGKAKELADLKKAIPEWWEVDFASLAPSVISDQQYGQRLLVLFKYADQQSQTLPVMTLYEEQRTDDRETRNGREYYKLVPVAYDYDAAEEFRQKALEFGTIPKIDQLREITRSIELTIKYNSKSEESWLPVLTDAEQSELDEKIRIKQIRDEQDRSVATVHLGDCVRGLRTYSGPKFDLILTDPPYGMAFQSNRRTASDKAKEIDGDDSIDAALKLFDAMMTAALPHLSEDAHVIVFCCDEFEPQFRALLAGKGLTFKRLLVWVKPNHGSGDLVGSFAPRKELALHFVQGSPSVSPRIDDVFIQEQGEFETDHPTEKPVSMLKAWINSTTQPGDLVLDPFMGTGATLVAAKQLDRIYRGFEMEEHYHGQAVERILAEVK